MICAACKTFNDNDAEFCVNCGTRLKKQYANKQITIGRASDNLIQVNNPKVSSHHAIIYAENGVLRIEDLNSSNGVYVNGKKVLISLISEKDYITLGLDYKLDWNVVLSHLIDNSNLNVVQRSNTDTAPKVKNDLSTKAIINIGRGSDCDIVIDNVKASRHHARIIKQSESYVIEDLNSGNGTFVNGERIKKKIINKTDKLVIAGIPINLNMIFSGKKITGDIKLSCSELSFVVENKTIVENISLTILPGEFVGLIGPSGAGKTTLMMMMNGVTRPSMGKVYINDESLYDNYESFKGLIGYVPQDDIIHRELKVEESLNYTAKLRFENYTKTEISQQVDKVIKTLDLSDTKQTLIGNAEKKGISGGQRKRVNLGQELLTEPSILFLDEPTSGLDPKSDHDVMTLLKSISEKGKIVVLTTHNITKENFEILSHLIVLTKGGKLAYFGPAANATTYFNVNQPFEIFDKLKENPPDVWKQKYMASTYYNTYVKERAEEVNINYNRSYTKIKKSRSNFSLSQLSVLVQRYFKIKLRDRISTLILLLQAPIIALMVALVFGKPEDKTSAIFILIISAIWLGCSNAAREIVSEQSIFKRERMVNLKIPSYIFSKIIVLSGLCLIQSIILVSIVHSMLDLNSDFLQLLLLIFVTAVSSLSIGFFISSVVNTNEAAMALIPIVLIPQIILAGFVSKFATMNEFIKVLSGLMISRWAFEAALITEYAYRQDFVISQIGFDKGNFEIDIAIILVFNLAFILLTTKMLNKKN